MDPADVLRWAELGHRKGWDLRVMYGQTEATARIAVATPDDLRRHPATVGRPLPGADAYLDADGELMVVGPQVMLGYATCPQDLALGRTINELRTGDLARIDADGRLDITGRRGRFAKVFGLRLDLERVESALQQRGISRRPPCRRPPRSRASVRHGSDARRHSPSDGPQASRQPLSRS